MDLESLFNQTPEIKKFNQELVEHQRNLLTGLVGSSKTIYIADLFKKRGSSILIVEDNLFHAQKMVDDLTNLVNEDDIYLFPVEEMLATEIAISSPEFKAQRISALHGILQDKPIIVVTSTAGIKRLLPQKEFIKQHVIHIDLDSEIDLTQLETQLFEMGFKRRSMVEAPGDFSIRGSIIDVYPLNTETPIRIDLFDTQVDSIRSFDAGSQRSISNLSQVSILPVTDFLVTEEMMDDAVSVLTKKYQKLYKSLDSQTQKEQLEKNIQNVILDLQNHNLKDEYFAYASILYHQQEGLLSYFDENDLIIWDDYARILDSEVNMQKVDSQWITDQLASQRFLPHIETSLDVRTLEKIFTNTKIFISLFKKGLGRMKFGSYQEAKTRAVQQFYGQMPLLKNETLRWTKKAEAVVVLVSDDDRVQKITQTLSDFGIDNKVVESDELQTETFQVVKGNLAEGFESVSGHLVVLTESELFARVKKKRPRRINMDNTERLKSYNDLKKGDYVVHVNHGIGRYVGMRTLEVSGKHQDYLTILYQNDAELFIPVSQLDRVQKYVASDSKIPTINKLGGTQWAKTKRKVAGKIKDIADELVKLYAKRESETGFAFPKDDEYQHDFDNAFPYPETDDQLRSINEIKKDMEKPRPMDRLLIGDVGFGKTEVALRAVFKAVLGGKQVAFLAPTTVLAQQHYETMIDRFDGFPVDIEILSRFSTSEQKKKTIKKLRNKQCDIVVGTHRLLSKDIKFADLGLLIIDEEQRFGVKHKERLKELKTSVDVLTLTATPIPRTLNMSMLGVRDLSVIETAPANRYPIQTYVIEQDYSVVVDAVRREMARGGQTFYLHNRVSDIEKVVSLLESLIPEARIAYIHGQMTEIQMENVLTSFISGEYDVLVTTTIIETGVDIPNANTLLVENADHMGLSQLYQLRGRVGRSNRIAYAYFMYRPDKSLTEESEKRLEAIKDFTELGSGFKIAMRDLSIRGAGNLLGKQQHGFIDSVGYDLYTQMLNEAVQRKRGIKPEIKTDAEVNLDIDAYIPDSYVEDGRQKIELYKQIRKIGSCDDYLEVQDDLIDRFGDYPQVVANLLSISLLKAYADRALVDFVKQNNNKIELQFSKKSQEKINGIQLLEASSMSKLKTSISTDDVIKIIVDTTDNLTDDIEQIEKILKKIVEFLKEKVGADDGQ